MHSYHLVAVNNWTEASYWQVVTPSLNAKDMFYYVQEIGHFYTLPGYSTERKHLNSFLVAYTVSGKGYLTYREKKYTLTAGLALFIHCEEYQYYETDPDDPWEFRWVHFNGGATASYFEQFMKNGGPVVRLDADSSLSRSIGLMEERYRNKDARTEALVSKYAVDMLTELYVSAIRSDREPEPAYLPDYVREAVTLLDRRYAEKITLDQLSSALAVSKYHLSREFKRYVGFTPNEYVIHTRISAAKTLLRSSPGSVADIAARTGFDNVSHFINMFKKHERLTPLAYRNKWR